MPLARTAENSPDILIEHAEGVYLFDISGKKYLDLIAGIAVNNLGHQHPKITRAVAAQASKYAHVMVYGEFIQSPQQELATKLAEVLPKNLSCSYLVNSGSEAVEGSIKLARKHTGRTEILSCQNAYHGSTIGALSAMGQDTMKTPFEPLVPDISQIEFNSVEDLDSITDKTAAVLVETIQGEAGIIEPKDDYLVKLKKRCTEVGTLLILDEIQTGMGRTGTMFGFENYGVIPDIVLLAKAFGGGYPLGAFVSSEEIMNSLSVDPALGHITTFGGHPVSCAAAMASLDELSGTTLIETVNAKGDLFRALLRHEQIREIRGRGLMLAVQLPNAEITQQVMDLCKDAGVITDWFLFADDCLRIAPPLIIDLDHIAFACEIILKSLDKVTRP